MKPKKQVELIYLNALNSLSFLGSNRIKTLLDHFGTAEAAWKAPNQDLIKILGLTEKTDKFNQERSKIEPEQEWGRLTEKKIKCITPETEGYPALLKQISLPPLILYYRGSLQKIDRPSVAIVGSRRCTFYGQEVAYRMAVELSEQGVNIISGMALGIDTAAHRGALDKSGYTVAVLGCGLDRCYPPGNADLMEQIVSDGTVISEFPIGTEPLPGNFPQRNRIISGLSLGTLVVEATAKSGALITSDYALEQNREVFAVPGNVGSPYSRGSHRLIKEGAKLVESAADILEELYINSPSEEQLTLKHLDLNLTEGEQSLIKIIPYQPMHIDKIIQLSGTKASEASALLLSLELKKCIRQSPGKYFCRI